MTGDNATTSAEEIKQHAINRRNFLKLAAAGAAASYEAVSPKKVNAATARPGHSATGTSGTGLLPAVPTLADLASDKLVHHFRDIFNPPLVQNDLGCLQVAKSVAGLTSITFPPFSCCRGGGGTRVTCEIFMNGQILTSFPPPAQEVAYTWYPHRVVRETVVQGIRFTTETFMPSRQQVVAELIKVTNDGPQRRSISLGFDMRGSVGRYVQPWTENRFGGLPEPYNTLTLGAFNDRVVFKAPDEAMVSVQGISPRSDRLENKRMLMYEISLKPGEVRTFHYINVIGTNVEDALDSYDSHQAKFEQLLRENEDDRASLLRSAFTPGNSDFSGHLPQLITSNRELWKLYYTGFTNLLVSRRISPYSVYGPTYVTIPPGLPTCSFIWDAMLTSLSFSLLDPQVLRSLLETWLTQDMHHALATDYLTGKGVGPWYGVNDMAILRCAHDYIRVTGDQAWLDKNVDGKPVLDHLLDHALYWKRLDKRGQGLADYGNMDNLLEVVSTWVHEVPAMNAGNVSGMRFVASILEHRGDSARAVKLRTEAKQLASRINKLLYVDGKGWWKTGQPNGTYNEVRHCYDLLTVLDMMFQDLSEKQKKEMSAFFWRELHEPAWMHALSPGDTDATFSLRADMSWLGAYTAWPAMTAKGLYKIDERSRVANWVKGLARSANQGPFGQAHMAGTIFPTENGGAIKSPVDQPYENNWYCISGGSFTDLVIDTIFGADLTLHDGIRVNSRLVDFDSTARLVNVSYQGKTFNVDRSGAEQV